MSFQFGDEQEDLMLLKLAAVYHPFCLVLIYFCW